MQLLRQLVVVGLGVADFRYHHWEGEFQDTISSSILLFLLIVIGIPISTITIVINQLLLLPPLLRNLGRDIRHRDIWLPLEDPLRASSTHISPQTRAAAVAGAAAHGSLKTPFSGPSGNGVDTPFATWRKRTLAEVANGGWDCNVGWMRRPSTGSR